MTTYIFAGVLFGIAAFVILVAAIEWLDVSERTATAGALTWLTVFAGGIGWAAYANSRPELTPEFHLEAIRAVPCSWPDPIRVTDTPPRDLYEHVVCDTSVSMGGWR